MKMFSSFFFAFRPSYLICLFTFLLFSISPRLPELKLHSSTCLSYDILSLEKDNQPKYPSNDLFETNLNEL